MTLVRHLTQGAHEHDFVVTQDIHGWNVKELEDSQVLSQVHYDDWHRVERDTWLFDLRAIDMKDAGWAEPGNSQVGFVVSSPLIRHG